MDRDTGGAARLCPEIRWGPSVETPEKNRDAFALLRPVSLAPKGFPQTDGRSVLPCPVVAPSNDGCAVLWCGSSIEIYVHPFRRFLIDSYYGEHQRVFIQKTRRANEKRDVGALGEGTGSFVESPATGSIHTSNSSLISLCQDTDHRSFTQTTQFSWFYHN